VLHGAPCRFSDPARFSLAHGGKDGHPFPVPLAVYDRTISVLKQAVSAARLGRTEKIEAIRRLDEQACRLEGSPGAQLDAYVAEERARSHENGGRDVSGLARLAYGQLPIVPECSILNSPRGELESRPSGPRTRPGSASRATGPAECATFRGP
jgi:hypothetical protein